MIEFAYALGERIEARDVANPSNWRPAVVMALKPYRGRPGYDISWTDIDRQAPNPNDAPRPSAGGWTYEACMRKII